MGFLGYTLNSWWIERLSYSWRDFERLGKHSNLITLICLMLVLINLPVSDNGIFLDYFSGFQNVPPVLVFNHLSTHYRCRRWTQLESICSQRKGSPLSCHSPWWEPIHWHPHWSFLAPCAFPCPPSSAPPPLSSLPASESLRSQPPF